VNAADRGQIEREAQIIAGSERLTMPKKIKVFLPAIFLIATLFAGPFFSLYSSAQPQG
jgi:hypothetical protein